jgi:hypothetical protein
MNDIRKGVANILQPAKKLTKKNIRIRFKINLNWIHICYLTPGKVMNDLSPGELFGECLGVLFCFVELGRGWSLPSHPPSSHPALLLLLHLLQRLKYKHKIFTISLRGDWAVCIVRSKKLICHDKKLSVYRHKMSF